MSFSLVHHLPQVVAVATQWAYELNARAQARGVMLNERHIKWARQVGVTRPWLIRLLVMDVLPVPSHPVLIEALLDTGLQRANMRGLTVGHSVYVQHNAQDSERVLRHEFRHVYQFEQAGSMEVCLTHYFRQIVAHGFYNAPLEVDARRFETESVAPVALAGAGNDTALR